MNFNSSGGNEDATADIFGSIHPTLDSQINYPIDLTPDELELVRCWKLGIAFDGTLWRSFQRSTLGSATGAEPTGDIAKRANGRWDAPMDMGLDGPSRALGTITDEFEHNGESDEGESDRREGNAALIRDWASHGFYAPSDKSIIRAGVLRALLIGLRPDWSVAPGELFLFNCKVEGDLFLEHQDRRYFWSPHLDQNAHSSHLLEALNYLPAFSAYQCEFEGVYLTKSKLSNIQFFDCTLKKLSAAGAIFEHDLDLGCSRIVDYKFGKPWISRIAVDLRGATINGFFDISAEGKLHVGKARSLDDAISYQTKKDRIKQQQSTSKKAYDNLAPKPENTINGGQLNHEQNSDDYSLILPASDFNTKSSKTASQEYCTLEDAPHFTCFGEVTLVDAKIGKSFLADGARIYNPGNKAVNLERAQVVGAVIFEASDDNLVNAADHTLDKAGKPLRNFRYFCAHGVLHLQGMTATDLVIKGVGLESATEHDDQRGSTIAKTHDKHKTTRVGTCINLREANIKNRFVISDVSGLHLNHDGTKGKMCISKHDGAMGIFDFRDAKVGRLEDDLISGWPKITKELDNYLPTMKRKRRIRSIKIDGFKYENLKPQDGDKDDEKHWTRIYWLSLQFSQPPEKSEFKSQPFEHLAQVMRAKGDPDLADRIAIEKRRYRRKAGVEKYPVRVMSLFLDIFCKYGYQPERAVGWLVVYWAFGYLLLILGLTAGIAEFVPVVPHVYEISTGRTSLLVHHEMVQQYRFYELSDLFKFFNAITGSLQQLSQTAERANQVRGCEAAVPEIYALDLMIPFAEFGQQSACHLQSTSPNFGFPVQLCRSLYQIVGTILTGVTITSMSGILRKD